MADDLLDLMADLRRRGVPFALATVVRCEAPTSAKPGSKVLIAADGSSTGWVGGACAQPVVVREALQALRDGQPRLIGLAGDAAASRAGTAGLLAYPMTCHSGGTLEIYVEPYLPRPPLVIVGHGPVVETLGTLGRAADYAVTLLGEDEATAALPGLGLTARASVVVATHGDLDEEALAHALAGPAGYVSLVASRRRAGVIVEGLRRRGLAPDRLSRLKVPAGLDIGAATPEEIAVSILAEIIQHRRSGKAGADESESAIGAASAAAEETDPICGMLVEVAGARYRSEVQGRTIYFCCRHCKDTFDEDPARYLPVLERSG